VAFLRNGHQVEEHSYNDLTTDIYTESLLSSEIVLLSCGGRAINKVINIIESHFNSEGRRPIIITNFPGIVVESQLEAFITRLRSDFVLLNSKKDERIYRKICKVFNIKFNGFVIGALWYTVAESEAKKTNNNLATVFYEQEFVPNKLSDRVVVAEVILKLAQQSPNRTFYIKNRGEELVESSIFSILKGLVEELPPNIAIFHGNVEEALLRSDSCITVSSSVALEAMLFGHNVFLLKVGDGKENHLDFFKGSELLVPPSFLNIDSVSKADKRWLEDNVANPNDYIKPFLLTLYASKRLMSQPVVTIGIRRKLTSLKIFYSFPFTFLSDYFRVSKKVNSAFNIIQGEKDV